MSAATSRTRRSHRMRAVSTSSTVDGRALACVASTTGARVLVRVSRTATLRAVNSARRGGNEEQARYWADEGGPSWVRDEVVYDLMLTPSNAALLEHLVAVVAAAGEVETSPILRKWTSSEATGAGAAVTAVAVAVAAIKVDCCATGAGYFSVPHKNGLPQ